MVMVEFEIEVFTKKYICKSRKLENGKLDVESIEFPEELNEELRNLDDDDHFELIDSICVCLDETELFDEEVFSMHLPI